MLLAISEEKAEDLLAELRQNYLRASVIGRVTDPIRESDRREMKSRLWAVAVGETDRFRL